LGKNCQLHCRAQIPAAKAILAYLEPRKGNRWQGFRFFFISQRMKVPGGGIGGRWESIL